MRIESFNDAKQFLLQIPNINKGGCGIAAFSLYRWIKKNEKEEPKITAWYDDFYIYSSNKGNIRQDNSAELHAPAHCGLKYKSKFIDSTGIIIPPAGYFIHNINEKTMLALINDAFNWREDFKRENIPIIAERLGIDLSDICLKVK